MLKLIFLTEQFYRDYSACPEIEQKPTRPYIRVGVVVGGILWAVPLRSHINHEYVIWTDKPANKKSSPKADLTGRKICKQ